MRLLLYRIVDIDLTWTLLPFTSSNMDEARKQLRPGFTEIAWLVDNLIILLLAVFVPPVTAVGGQELTDVHPSAIR